MHTFEENLVSVILGVCLGLVLTIVRYSIG